MIEPKYQKLSEKLEAYIAEKHLTGRLPGVLRLSHELGIHHVTLMKAIRLLKEIHTLPHAIKYIWWQEGKE